MAVLSPPAPAHAVVKRAAWVRRFRRRLPLLCVLAVQAVFTLRLGNSAFQDEALYLYAGHREIAQFLHGTPTFDNYTSYFSGAPGLYPVLGAAVDGVFGLAGARALSTVLLLGTTLLLNGATGRLFGRAAGLGAAALFAVSAPTLFVGHLATYDAPALFLLALGTWLVVRTARLPFVLVVTAAPVLVLAVATKYAAALFLPSIIALAILADPVQSPPSTRSWPWVRALLRGVLLAIATAGLVWLALRLAGPAFTEGLRATTTNRQPGTDPVGTVLTKTLLYGGATFAIALVGAVAYAWAGSGDEHAPKPPAWLRWVLATLLCGTALLAPAYQVHLHTLVSLHKHIDYGLFFAAPLAGVAVARVLKAGARDAPRLVLTLAICAVVTASGLQQSGSLYREWPDAGPMVEALRTQVRPVTGRYLVEESEVPRYYLAGLTRPFQWTGTYFFVYKDKKGNQLTGVPAYRAAIADRYFDVIVLRYGPTAALDVQIDADLKAQRGYELIAKAPGDTRYGKGTYYVWRAVH